jgi:Tol biopolymer transport system component
VKWKPLPPLMLLVMACSIAQAAGRNATPLAAQPTDLPSSGPIVPHEGRWGIYRLHLDTQVVDLVYSSPVEIAGLRLDGSGSRFVFSQKGDAERTTTEEIYTLSTEGTDLRRITTNDFWDLYPVWSPDGSRMAFLSQRVASLGIYVMNADGSDVGMLLDSSAHEADIDWRGEQIVFTRDSRIWIMQSDGSGVRQVTNPPRAGEWGNANLPFGDYDPRLSPDGTHIVFERLVGDQSAHGNYDFFLVDVAGSQEVRLTHSGYSQGLASWSNSGDEIAYIVAAVGEAGRFDIYLTGVDGTETRDVTPAYFPSQFLCHSVVYSVDDKILYFVGEWWA